MYYQSDPRFPVEIQKWGCNFLSLLTMTEIESNVSYKYDDILHIYDKLRGIAYDSEVTVDKPDTVLNYAFQYLGVPKRGHQIGVVIGDCSFWEWTRIYTILKGKTKNGFHFRLGDRNGKLIFDPFPQVVIEYEVHKIIYQVVSR